MWLATNIKYLNLINKRYCWLWSVIFFSIFVNINGVNAEEMTPSFQMPGRVEGTGTDFEINNSEYLNLKLYSSEPIKLIFESVPEMVTMIIEPVTSIVSTQITINGFNSLTTYYKYQDDYHNLTEFTTDANGIYSYTQDISKPHFVFIQPRKSTKFIKDDSAGGDCYLIGNWNNTTKICTLTTDLNETIQIDNNNITLDGNNHVLTGNNTGSGVYVYGKNGVVIKNLNINDFFYGILVYSADNNTLLNNIISFNQVAVFLAFANSNSVLKNTISNNLYGIDIGGDPNMPNSSNEIIDNTINYTHYHGIHIGYSDNILIANNIINDNGRGVGLKWTSNSKIIGNFISNTYIGIDLAVDYAPTVNNIFERNTINATYWFGIYIFGYGAQNNKFYQNNIIDAATPAAVQFGSGNIFNLDKPTGGNYWINFDESSEGCNDLNNDNFCDSSYYFSGGQDNLPWKLKDGWPLPQQPSQFYSQVSSSSIGGLFNIRKTAGSQNKPSDDILKTVPDGWIMKVLKTTDGNGNNIDIDDYRWYQVEDKTDGTIGWMAGEYGQVKYLPYEQNKQTDLEQNASQQITTREERTNKIAEAVDHYYDIIATNYSLYSSNDFGNNISILKEIGFPKELILAIAAQESGGIDFDNEWVSVDYGHGIMQITFQALYNEPNNYGKNKWDNRGKGSRVTIPLCRSIGSNLYIKCYTNAGIRDEINLKPYKYYNNDLNNPIYKQYTNTHQSIYSNIKDSLQVLQEKYSYNRKCPSDDISASGYLYTCYDREKILTTCAYNGNCLKTNYLSYVADKLKNLGNYFSGRTYSNNDNLIEKMKLANNYQIFVKIKSPGELYVIDSQSRVTGLISGEIKNEISNAGYDDDNKAIFIIFPTDSYSYKIVGTEEGTYGLTITSVEDGTSTSVEAINIPISIGEVHNYSINWTALANNEKGVTLGIDYEGDGIIDRTVTSRRELYDIEPPQINTPSLEQEYLFNSPLQIQYSATDDSSGVASVSATLNGIQVTSNQIVTLNKPGTNRLEIIAIDNAGNVAILVKTFNVVYNFGGFLSPIKADDSGVYKQGRTLPIKFQLTDVNSSYIGTATPYLYIAKIADGIVGSDKISLSTSNADVDNKFRYDQNANQYIYNLSTKSITPGTWQLKVILDDGKSYIVLISIKN